MERSVRSRIAPFPFSRSYQEEVDTLTKRAKYAESGFLDMYQRLYEAPDPTQALVSAMELVSQGKQGASRAALTSGQLPPPRPLLCRSRQPPGQERGAVS